MPKETKFHGILAVGRTKADAVNNYRLLAMSKGATVQVDNERNIAFVTQASHAGGMFNPQSGNMDLETEDTYLDKLEFQSNSSGSVEVNHLVCAAGCGTHIVFDSADLVKYCPHCTSDLSAVASDEGDEDEDEEEDYSDMEDADLEEGADDESEDETSESADEDEGSDDESDEDASADEEDTDGSDSDSDESDDAAKGKKEEEPVETFPEYTEEDGAVVISSGEDDNHVVVAADSFDNAATLLRQHLPATSLSSDQTTIEVFHVVCSDAEGCGAHILSTQEVDTCPACQSETVEPTVEASSDGPEDAELNAEVVETKVDPKNDTKVEAADEDESEDEDSDESEDDASGDESEEGDEGDESEDDDSESNTLQLTDDSGNILTEGTEEVDAMSEVEETAESSDLDVSYSSNVAGQSAWTAFYRGKPVAMASKSSAGNNADIFDTPSFGHAVLATAKVGGVKKSLAELGFKSIKHTVSVSAEVRRLVEREVATAREALAADQAQFKERFEAALATAAIGLNRGFFADQKNPIKGTLWNALSSAGIRNPEILIDNAFKAHADAYHKQLIGLANDIIAKPMEVQESLSKTILGMSYQAVSSSEAGSIEDRLETLGTSVSSGKPEVQPAAEAGIARQQITAAVQTLGRRGR